MDKIEIKALEQLNVTLDKEKAEVFDKFAGIFIEKNSRINLISKKDAKLLFEKHIFDSLAINLFLKPQKGQTLLDIGTGGGFPSVPIAIFYDDIEVFALDSIRKKIKAIEEMKDELNIKNLFLICDRAENIEQKYDYITTRAVSSLETVLKYAIPHLKKGGYFIAYKSKKAIDELKEAEKTIKKLNVKLVKIIDYNLPLEENHERNLMIFTTKN
jgi:16S rRNA (guanine527-N7)-methyltransferase